MSTGISTIESCPILVKDEINDLSEALRVLDEKFTRTVRAPSTPDIPEVAPSDIRLGRWLKYGKGLEGLLLSIKNTDSGSVTAGQMDLLHQELDTDSAEATFPAKYRQNASNLQAWCEKHQEGWRASPTAHKDMYILATITKKVRKECWAGLGFTQTGSPTVVNAKSVHWADEVLDGDDENL